MFFRKRILVANVWVLNSVQQHVHAADAQHRRIEVEAIEELFIEMMAQFIVGEDFRVTLSQVFTRGDKKAGRTTRWIANDVARLWRDHFNHQTNDVTRRAELPVLSGSRDLAEHVLVKITFGISILHR